MNMYPLIQPFTCSCFGAWMGGELCKLYPTTLAGVFRGLYGYHPFCYPPIGGCRIRHSIVNLAVCSRGLYIMYTCML